MIARMSCGISRGDYVSRGAKKNRNSVPVKSRQFGKDEEKDHSHEFL